MIRNIAFGFLFLVAVSASGQGIIQAGAHIVLDNNPSITIDGNQGHYYDTLGGLITVEDTGTIYVPGNWTNSSGTSIFTTNNGLVVLNGAVQYIGGRDMTAFPTLDLRGTDDKHLNTNVLVGGGHRQGGDGMLKCNSHLLWLDGNRLVVNNASTLAINNGLGGIVSETDFASGYGEVQWNIRENQGNFEIPFRTATGAEITQTLRVIVAGTNANDSGYITTATYPTAVALAPNNRPLPNGVGHSNNEYGRENASHLIDRFWVADRQGFSTNPSGDYVFGYREEEWNTSGGSTNEITEANLRPVLFESGNWTYPGSGSISVATNKVTGADGLLSGVWTLADTTICPVALFRWDGNCEQEPIVFTDESTISSGNIESWDWIFGDGGTYADQDTSHSYPTSGTYQARLIVIGNSGCPDTIINDVEVDARAIADFTIDDDPLVDYPVTFTENTQNADEWDWDFGDFQYSTGAIVTHTYESEASFDVTLIANNPANCPDTTVKSINVNLPSLFLVPDAFTPGDQDEINRTIGLVTLQRVSEFSYSVYNRWGELIYHTDNADDKWDGTYQGANCPPGSYLYIMSFRDRRLRIQSLSGSFMLIR